MRLEMGSLRQKASGADGLRLWVALSAGESVSDSKSLVRERLYCSSIGSNDHMSVQFTLHRVGTTMAKCMAPLLPHLAAQFFQHQPNCSEKLILRDVLNFDGNNDIPMHPELDRAMEKIMLLR
nr:CRE-IARS-2 protein [Haemonchus contortus]